MILPAWPRSQRSERGAINWVTLVLLVSLVSGAYLAVVWGPVYIIRYEVGVVATEFANKAVHNHDDASLVKELCDRLVRLDRVKAPAADGSIELVPAVSVRPADVTWERDTVSVPPTIHVAFEYTTSVHYLVLDRFTEKTFAIERFQDIQPAKW
jgi:hypothetical protein